MLFVAGINLCAAMAKHKKLHFKCRVGAELVCILWFGWRDKGNWIKLILSTHLKKSWSRRTGRSRRLVVIREVYIHDTHIPLLWCQSHTNPCKDFVLYLKMPHSPLLRHPAFKDMESGKESVDIDVHLKLYLYLFNCNPLPPFVPVHWMKEEINF